MTRVEKLNWLGHWLEECSGVTRNEQRGKSFCPECDFKPSCDLAALEITALIRDEVPSG